MKEKIKITEVIICTFICTVILVLFEIYVSPLINIKFDIFADTMRRITNSQHIDPKRLYINVWRTAKNTYADSSMNGQNWNRWRNRYSSKIKTIEDANIAINTMLTSLDDSYTRFLRSDLYSKQKVILDSQITGVGVIFNKLGDEVIINQVLDDSPAQEANIFAGDTIVSIDGIQADINSLEVLMNYIENSKKDTVEIVLKRNNVLIVKKLKKKAINIKTMDYRITADNIGIITLSSIMGAKAVEDFKNILIKTNDTKALIIDLRNNYGGILANVLVMADFMTEKNEIFSINSRGNKKYPIYSTDEKIFKTKPIIILINGKTASAAEILAGTLRINADAVLLGENSFGKNSIQQVIPMQNKSGLVITTYKYLLPDDSDIYRKGLAPDIHIKQPPGRKDVQKEIALKLLRDINVATK